MRKSKIIDNMSNNDAINNNMDFSILSDNSNTDPLKCPFNPEAGCTLSRIVYNSINSNSKTSDIDNFLEKTKSPNKENMICNIDNRFLVDTDMNLITIPVYTYKFDNIDMLHGFYQRSLPSKTSCHLILLRMDKNCGMVPKMQLGHHGLSLRLCDASSMIDLRQTKTTVDLAICQI